MKEAKKIDGIKKLDKEDLKKSREIVLDSIGESSGGGEAGGEAAGRARFVDGMRPAYAKVPAEKLSRALPLAETANGTRAAEGGPIPPRLDSVFPSKTAAVTESGEKEKERPEDDRRVKKWREEAKGIFAGDDSPRERENERGRYARPAVNRKKTGPLTGKKPERNEKKLPNGAFRRETGSVIGVSEDAAGKTADKEASKRKEREMRERERDRREKERRRICAAKAEEKKSRREIRRGKIKAAGKKIGEWRRGFSERLKFSARKAGYYLLILSLAGIFLYFLAVAIVTRFDAGAEMARKISRFLPIPAIVTKYGVIDYRQYMDLYGTAGESADSLIAEKIVLNNLARKYGLPPVGLREKDDELKKQLAGKIIYDKEVNMVALNRIEKIKELVDKNGDFARTANRLGDEQGQLDITDENEAARSYAAGLRNLNAGEISGVIVAGDEYSLFKCYEKTPEMTSLSYVSVKTKTLDAYIAEAVRDIKMWSLMAE